MSGLTTKLLTAAGEDEVPRSHSVYAIPGTYSWVCPEGVTSVSVVCVGGGGGASHASGGVAYKTGGGGGALAYKNNISVNPGQSYTVRVGAGGFHGYTHSNYGTTKVAGENGGQSYFISPATVSANGGGGGPISQVLQGYPHAAATYIGDGGGNGGRSGSSQAGNYSGRQGGGGGGAGGYSGAGGTTGAFNGYNTATGNLAVNATGGGGSHGGPYTTKGNGGGGGGTGIFGEGASGTVGANFKGGGGSGGEDGGIVIQSLSFNHSYAGVGANGGWPGGGGAITSTMQYNDQMSGEGAGGAVRIVWPGDARQFPTTDVANN